MSRSIPVAKSDVIYVRTLGYSDRILIKKIVVDTYLVTNDWSLKRHYSHSDYHETLGYRQDFDSKNTSRYIFSDQMTSHWRPECPVASQLLHRTRLMRFSDVMWMPRLAYLLAWTMVRTKSGTALCEPGSIKPRPPSLTASWLMRWMWR